MNAKRAVFAVLLLAPAGCPKPENTPTQEPAPPRAAAPEVDTEEKEATVAVSEPVAALCDLPRANFSFNSTKLSSDAQAALNALAQCFISGPARDKGLRLVGHADPRGDEEYNFALGQRRAGSVATYLTKKGLDSSRVESSSRGELDARGSDEASWALDRKVEIYLND